MNISNVFDFDSRIDFLLNTYEENIEDNIEKQGAFLNSDTMNNNFEKIENYLNDMYEKCRLLEEVIEYAKSYVNNEIDTTIDECRDLLNDIENMNDDNFENSKNYITTNVSLVKNDVLTHNDRDGSVIKQCEFYNGNLSLAGTIKNILELKSVSVKREEQCYESNYKDIIHGKPYRVHYLLDNVNKKGITESLTITLPSAREVNSIKVKLSNCQIVNIVYIHEDNSETIDTESVTGVVPVKKVKAIRFVINSSNYQAKDISLAISSANKFESLNQAWREYHEEVKEKDISITTAEYKRNMSEYLDNLYLKEVK